MQPERAGRSQGYVTKLSPKGIRPLLGYLDGLGFLPAGEDVRTPVDPLLNEFRRSLLEERAVTGIAANTADSNASKTMDFRIFLP